MDKNVEIEGTNGDSHSLLFTDLSDVSEGKVKATFLT